MAFPAIHFLVLALEREMRFAVVKFAQTALVGKRLGIVAFFAIEPELPLVFVLVAIGATFKGHVGKFLKLGPVSELFFVAFNTGYISVFAREREVGLVVVEFFGRIKFIGIVAFCTIFPERFLVGVFVAIHAFLPDTQKGFLFLFQFRLLHIIRLVAAPAINFLALAAPAFFVPSGQFKAGEIVVEGVFIKANHVEFPAVVIAVTFGAFLSPHLRGGVEALVSVDPRFDLFVAFEAFVVRYLVAQIVAFGTI
jgi:hypothetical protein